MKFLACLLILVSLSLSNSLFAQDLIIFKNGDEIQARVKEIDPNNIKYDRFDNPGGPLYTIHRSDVFMIKYENGTKDILTDLSVPVPTSSSKNFGNEYRSPGLAFLFSFLLPGGGQYYNREYVKGGVMTGVWFAGLVSVAAGAAANVDCYENRFGDWICDYNEKDGAQAAISAGGTVMFGTWLWSVIDAPVRASRNNRGLKATGLLEFEKEDKFSLKVEPFRSQGLGGGLSMKF